MSRYLRDHTLYDALIATPPSDRLGLVVVIPAKDEEDILTSLESLRACERPGCDFEVIVVVNTGEADAAECVAANVRQAEAAAAWAAEFPEFHILQCHGLKKKHAGVGLARKIGMDEACRRLGPRGVIACFDADSRCEPNYLVEIARLFRENEECQACSIRFEHPVSGNEFERSIYDAIIRYELHLRYFIHAQKFAGFPHAVQTIGSSMAVRCDAYQEQNGMPKRQAGEDFYFMHKFTPLGKVLELKSTCVIPSPRRSHRVPFGTGKAVGDFVDAGGDYLTYAPQSFVDLREFLAGVGGFYVSSDIEGLPESVRGFLATQGFTERVEEIRANVTSAEGFRVRFFKWFNAFLVMKFVHYARDRHYPNVEVTEAARWLVKSEGDESALELLMMYRGLDVCGEG